MSNGGPAAEGKAQPAINSDSKLNATSITIHMDGDTVTNSGASSCSPTVCILSGDGHSHNELAERELVCRAALVALNGVGLADFLHRDPRPTFILDLSIPDIFGKILQPVYCNPALLDSDSRSLLNLISGKENLDAPGAYSLRPYARFRKWMFAKELDSAGTFSYSGMLWTKVVVKDRWSVVSGVQSKPSWEPTSPMNELSPVPTRAGSPVWRTIDQEHEGKVSISGSERREDSLVTGLSGETVPQLIRWDSDDAKETDDHSSALDWTRPVISSTIPDHVRLFRSIDWSVTPLGPMEKWAPELRLMVNLILRIPEPRVLFWGEEVVMIYNEAYVPLLGDKHPACMGNSAKIAFKDYWDHFCPYLVRSKLTGEWATEKDLPIFLSRNGILEETYFSFTFLPVVSEKGSVIGHYEPITEVTKEVVSERRLAMLLKLSEETAGARNLDDFWGLVLRVLASNDKDVPFALLYAVEDEEDAASDAISTAGSTCSSMGKHCILKGSLGVPDGHPAAPAHLDLSQNGEGFRPYLRKTMQVKKPVYLDLDDGSLPSEMVEGIQWRGFGDPCRSLVICPITPTTSKNALGFLISGLNPRRPYDEDYQQFMTVSTRLLATSLASVVLHEEEIRRRERMIAQAELMKSRLVEQLVVSQKDVERHEKKFQRFAERADVGIFIVGSDGHYTYRNNRWYEIFQLPQELLDIRDAWPQLAYPEDIAACQGYFVKLLIEKLPVSFELRLRRSWVPPGDSSDTHRDSHGHNVWILCSAYPELDDNGDVSEIVGCVTDISRQKWAEVLQKKRTEDALESKRQLENFIDTTSHEMRNPLSAIIQCADGIITSNNSLIAEAVNLDPSYRQLLEMGNDAAQTIVQCSTHMKCIVDDILTMSKLDSGLLVITPVDAQPESIARHAVKMFEAEAKAADVHLNFEIQPSYQQLGIDWVSLDPTRLLQVLINLVTNAIKFTRLEAKRSITVSLGASVEQPTMCEVGNVPYIRTEATPEAPSLVADWSQGENVYIQFAVQDSGRGLSNNEKDLLFTRFSQASPRTHISYGGSGLGLFISRRLTEMQGGAIGFSSQSQEGSTFSFYIRARRTQQSPLEGRFVTDLMTPVRAETPTSSLSGSPTRIRSPELRTTSTPSIRPMLEYGQSSLLDTLHVLVVEDNLVNQRVLANQLRKKGCQVSVANHGGEALDYLSTTNYCTENGNELSLILMDWEMPVMDGLSCVKAIRKLQKQGKVRGHVPIIAVTANVRNEQIDKATEAGMDDVVSKPFRVPELMKRMRALILRLSAS